MLKFAPILLAVLYAFVLYRFSVWRTGKMLDAQSTPLRDPGLRAMTDRLARALELPAIDVRVYEVEPVNGLAAPDGRIFLTRGFLNRYARGHVSAEEMASVIAHELGHVALGHTRRRMIDVTGQNAVFVMLAALLGRFIPIVGIYVANAISTALAAGLSRRAEHEADAYASALLVKAGIGTGPQKSLFRKLETLTGAVGAGPPEWLRSHPKTAERIRAIEDREARWTQL
ncbi:MAG: M48 family metallopeptidase [Paracoccaceae bacterium]|nr:M48 family metallopeptidase [Paracoccaceae bacterium]